MKKKVIIIVSVIIAVTVGAFFMSREIAKQIIENTYTVQETTEWQIATEEDEISGDTGINEMPVIGINNALDIPEENRTYKNFWNFILTYNESIPFSDNQFYWLEGYTVFADGIDNRFTDKEQSQGMGSLGYCLWIYRNIFGICDEALLEPQAMKESLFTDKDLLQIGDLGMYEKDGKFHYGVFVGNDGENKIFTHCDSIPTKLYPGGCNKLAYLDNGTELFYMGNRPVPFEVFVKVDLDWE